MNFVEEARGYNYRRDKEEDEEEQEQSDEEELQRIGGGEDEEEDQEEGEEAAATTTTRNNNITSSTSKHHQYISNLPSTTSSSVGSAATATTTTTTTSSPRHFSYKDFLQEFTHPHPHPHPRVPHPSAGAHLVDLSLGNSNIAGGGGGEGTSSSMMMVEEVEKEHMFDKVVTPSDVGKLNRLVIPKQHAEKYFPLDGSSNEKGLLLNFEDRNGKPWRFRYSYWNSSQSYVMTKGWSRFVKEKKLDAGDIVSFQRGAGEDSRHRLFIDWKRRPTIGPHPDFPMAHHHLDFQNVRWGNRLLYSLPPGPPPPPSFHYSLAGYNVQVQPYAGHYNQQLYARGGAAPYYVRPAPGHLHHHQQHHHHQVINAGEGGGVIGGGGDDVSPMVIDSVPVVQGRTVGKRLRLFGVNMDCPIVPPPASGSGNRDDHHHRQHPHHREEADFVGYNRPTYGLIPPPPRHSGSSSSPSPSPSGGNYMMGSHQFPPVAGSSLQLRLPSSGGGGGGGSSSSSQSHELSKKGKSTSLSFDLDL